MFTNVAVTIDSDFAVMVTVGATKVMSVKHYSHHRRFTINNIFIDLIINVLIAFATSVIIITCIIIITFAIIVVIVEIVIPSATVSPHNVRVLCGE